METRPSYTWPIPVEGLRHKPYALVLGASQWKNFLGPFLPERRVKKYSKHLRQVRFIRKVIPKLLLSRGAQLFVWGFKEPAYLERYRRFAKLPLVRIEDGFLRSVSLGAHYVPPMSLCFDARGIYFDATGPSDLEHILATYDFDGDSALMERARAGVAAMLATGLSKYNNAKSKDTSAIFGPKERKRVLVLGQVEGDQSILRGCTRNLGNLDAVRIAREENPEAQIIYKPHPEVIHGTRDGQSDPKLAEAYSEVLYDSVALADVFVGVDHVYTITSLAGFEALMRGLKVTCLGAPFYSGWGLTDDRQWVDRRGRQLTVEQVFAAAYILYSRYCNPFTLEAITFEQALDLLGRMRSGEIAETRVS